MRLFNTISIETGSRCNRRCWFCPNATNEQPDEYLNESVITDLAIQLRRMKYKGRIELYIYNEPLLDHRLADIIREFRTVVPNCCIMIATNCDYARSYRDFQKLYDAGLNQLQANIYESGKRYQFVEDMLEQTSAEPGNVYLYQSPRKRVYTVEAKYGITQGSDKVGRFELNNRSGNVPDLPMVQEPLEKVCVRPFRYMQVNWKGEVILCCNDYHGDVVVGHVKTHTLDEIWFESKILQKYRKKLIYKFRYGLPLCVYCSFKGGAYTHLIQKQWPELLE